MNPMTTVSVGDVLTRPTALGVVSHVAVAVAPDLVVQNTPERGEHLATLKDFSDGKPVQVHRTGADPSTVVARARTVLANPQRYDVLGNNCEHTVTRIVHGIARSPQLAFFGAVALVGVLVLVARRG